MGTFAGNTLIDDLSRRLRDTANLGYPRATVLDIINRTQRSVNAHLGLVTNTASLTTTNVSLYSVSALASDVVRVIEVRDGNRTLHRVRWDHLVHQDPRWLRRFGQQPEIFSNIGRELLAITPIPVIATSLTVLYIKKPTDLADAGAPLWDLPDEHKPLVLDLAEAILLFRGREFPKMQMVLSRLMPALTLEDILKARQQADVSDRT